MSLNTRNLRVKARSNKELLIDTAFLLAAATVAIVFYLESLTFSARSARIPRLIITVILVLIGVTLTYILLRSYIADVLDIDLIQEPLQRGIESEIKMTRVIREFGIILAFSIIITFVGYFTTSFLYAYLYIFAHTEDTGRRRYVVPAIWAGAVTALAYAVFIYIVESITLLRLGYFL